VSATGENTGTAERLRKLQLVADAALAHLSLEALFDELLTRVRDIMEADTCAVLLLDERTNELVARAAKGIEEEVERGVRIPLGKGFAGRIAAGREPVVIDDLGRADVVNPILREKGIVSMLGAPLLARDRVLGVLHVGTLRPRRFTDDDVELLTLAAERAALGIERAMIHDDLLRLDRARHQFISIASHELRTPASAVYGAAATLERLAGRLEPEREAELRHMLAEQSERLVALLEQLLDLSRLEAHGFEPRPQELGVRARLETIVSGLHTEGSKIELAAADDLEIETDELAFDRIVSNLVVNAIRHGRPPIVVSAVRADRHLRVAVEDSGPGVAEEFRGRLFEQFARPQDSAGAAGSGLGLAIARSYARAQGGDIFYADAQPHGARFEVVLPVRART
jgi:signal transduction histidine kinase